MGRWLSCVLCDFFYIFLSYHGETAVFRLGGAGISSHSWFSSGGQRLSLWLLGCASRACSSLGMTGLQDTECHGVGLPGSLPLPCHFWQCDLGEVTVLLASLFPHSSQRCGCGSSHLRAEWGQVYKVPFALQGTQTVDCACGNHRPSEHWQGTWALFSLPETQIEK
jgi:hypothetical protein